MSRKVKFVGKPKCEYLSPEKEYDVIEEGISFGPSCEKFITIIDDNGDEVFEHIEWRYHVGQDCEWVFV